MFVAAVAAAWLLLLCGLWVWEIRRREFDVRAYFTGGPFLLAPLNAVAEACASWRGKLVTRPSAAVFPGVERLRAALPMLREELRAALLHAAPLRNEPNFTTVAKDVRWKRFYLRWYGDDPLARRVCPRTCALLDGMPEVNIAMFSILEPGAVIPPHHGPTAVSTRYHMALEVPRDRDRCFLTVGGVRYAWTDGEDVAFNDTFRHSVVNDTADRRVVLFLDLKRPMRWRAVYAVFAALGDVFGPLTHRLNDRQEVPRHQ
jgi:aspartyl/asparaginyl beta-hydroxylase (cupin superfamily)